MAHKMGSLSWANETDGKVSFFGKLSYTMQLISTQIQLMLRNEKVKVPPFDIDSIRIPDTAFAKQASELCETVSTAPLYLHCVRSYYWGNILAQQNKLKFDEELFYVMAILHDIALTDAYHLKDPHAECFAVEGGRAAQAFCADHGWDEHRATQINEAISLHLNVDVPVSDGVEAHLLRAGSGMDVFGARRWEVAKETRTAILERFPREGLADDLRVAFTKETQARPDSRSALLWKFAQGGDRLIDVGL